MARVDVTEHLALSFTDGVNDWSTDPPRSSIIFLGEDSSAVLHVRADANYLFVSSTFANSTNTHWPRRYFEKNCPISFA